MKPKKMLFLLCLSLMMSCDQDETVTFYEVQIRLSNKSEVDFENASFNGLNYGAIKAGEQTAYEIFEKSYSYGSVAITINGKEYGWIPIDFVGETPLKTGKYTFEYYFDPATELLRDQLVKD